MKRLFVAYRRNTLFDTYVPSLLEGLDVVGTFIVPQGVAFDTCSEAALAAAISAQSAGAEAILVDSTCGGLAYRRNERGLSVNRFRPHIGLDYCFSQEVDRLFPVNTVGDNLAWFATQVVANRQVAAVVVIADCITDHKLVGVDTHQQWGWHNADLPHLIGVHAQRLFPAATVTVVRKLEDALLDAQDPTTLLILDRHCGIKKLMQAASSRKDDDCAYFSLTNWPHPSQLMMLPFETCLGHLIESGQINYSFNIGMMRAVILRELNA